MGSILGRPDFGTSHTRAQAFPSEGTASVGGIWAKASQVDPVAGQVTEAEADRLLAAASPAACFKTPNPNTKK